MEKDKKIILVTGGAGFIGSHLIEELVKDKNNKLISLDNYFIGTESNHIDGAEYIEGDTRDIFKLIKTIPDILYHLGEYSRVEQSFDDVKKVWEYNVAGTFQVLEFCRENKCKIIYAGSSTKFADGGMGRDQSPYAWMKASNTELIRNYGNWFGLNYAIAYFYNVYGPRELPVGKYARVIECFTRQMRDNEPITVVSPGTQLRNFTYVGDIVDGLIKVGEKGSGDEYGLGSDEQITILELAKLFSDNIKMLPERPGNRMDSKVETFRAKNEFGWEAKHSVVDYVKEIKKSYKSYKR